MHKPYAHIHWNKEWRPCGKISASSTFPSLFSPWRRLRIHNNWRKASNSNALLDMNHDYDESRHFYESDGTVLHPNNLSCHPNYTVWQTATKQIWTTAAIAVSLHLIMIWYQFALQIYDISLATQLQTSHTVDFFWNNDSKRLGATPVLTESCTQFVRFQHLSIIPRQQPDGQPLPDDDVRHLRCPCPTRIHKLAYWSHSLRRETTDGTIGYWHQPNGTWSELRCRTTERVAKVSIG